MYNSYLYQRNFFSISLTISSCLFLSDRQIIEASDSIQFRPPHSLSPPPTKSKVWELAVERRPAAAQCFHCHEQKIGLLESVWRVRGIDKVWLTANICGLKSWWRRNSRQIEGSWALATAKLGKVPFVLLMTWPLFIFHVSRLNTLTEL